MFIFVVLNLTIMPHYYAKQEPSIDFTDVLQAIKEVKMYNMSIWQVTAAHNIPKSNLARYIAKLNEAAVDVSTENNDVMVDLLKDISRHGAKPVSLHGQS